MKAVVLERYGSPEDLSVQEVAVPEPRRGEVLVKVHASAVNDWDWSIVRGRPYVYRLMFGLTEPRTRVLGMEIAGTVEAVGDGATRLSPGQRVYGDLSDGTFGAFAEYVCVPEGSLRLMPAGMTFEQAAALPHAGLLGWQGLVEVGRIQKGERVLLNAAGGGVGALALQIAKGYGCEVTGVDKASKLEALTAMGFDHVLDYQRTDFTAAGERYDLILDARTTRSPARHLRALRPGGRYVSVGGDVSRLLQAALLGWILSKATGKRLAILALKPNEGLERIGELFEAGSLRPVIDGPYDLADAPRAVARFGAADHVGKIVIKVA
jgi:NADPH:quinone reductase-like Zn-dependent oxidoreductase